MDNLYNQKTTNNISVFDNRFLSARNLYMHYFSLLPNVNYIGSVDGEKAFNTFKEKYQNSILHVHQYHWYKHENKKYQFEKTMVVLKQNVLIEFDESYCYILHDGSQQELLEELTALAKQYKERQRKKPLEINLIVKGSSEMELKAMEIKRTKLNLDLFYEDDFKAVDETIRARLSKDKDKGIVLLHGLPGTGKTTYLRYLIGKIKKRVMFLSPNVAGNLMDPDFIELLIDNPNTVVVIEDAENIIMDRGTGSDSSVSNLLNISDGLLADFLNVQLICTFNSSLTLVDNALMRKGRLIAKYEFGKLSIEKSQKLSDHLGFKTIINKPMTLAEITNQHEKNFETRKVQVIGFRREVMMEN
jgi:SpoVK/Ycf46/Vps4 family AAA+-type ATPase